MREKNMAHKKENTDSPPKKNYVRPSLRRYNAPKLRKHKSYKDITQIVINPAAPPPVS